MKNLVKQNTCFKNLDKPTCIDLIPTNYPSFQNTDTFETGLSDFLKLTFTILKQHFPKQKPRVVIHWQYKNFSNDYFRIKLENALLKYDINNIMIILLNLPNCFGQACSNKKQIFTDKSCQFCDNTVKKGYNEKIKIT